MKNIAVTKKVSYYLQYRLAGDELFTSAEQPWKEDLNLNFNKALAFAPSSQWRDFLYLLGIDFLLYEKEVTRTTTETITTSTVPEEELQDNNDGEDGHANDSRPSSRSKGGSSSSDNSSNSSTGNGKQSGGGKSARKKKARGKAEAAVQTKTETDVQEEADTQHVLLGVAKFDTSFLIDARGRDFSSFQVDKLLTFEPVGVEELEKWDPQHQRRLPFTSDPTSAESLQPKAAAAAATAASSSRKGKGARSSVITSRASMVHGRQSVMGGTGASSTHASSRRSTTLMLPAGAAVPPASSSSSASAMASASASALAVSRGGRGSLMAQKRRSIMHGGDTEEASRYRGFLPMIHSPRFNIEGEKKDPSARELAQLNGQLQAYPHMTFRLKFGFNTGKSYRHAVGDSAADGGDV